MKFLKEDFEDDPSLDTDETFMDDETDDSMVDDGTAEIEMVLAEPSKLVDVDGSVVLVGAGDVVNIQSESLKRIKQ
jgi:hypothetical protein